MATHATRQGPTNDEKAERLEEIRDEIKELIDEAKRLLHGSGDLIEQRAKGYWLAHIVCALDKEHGYLGGSMLTMQDTIDELKGDSDEEEGE